MSKASAERNFLTRGTMTRSSQKQDERDILDAYLKARGLAGDVRDGPEPPDFLVKIDGSVVGFEVTEYHQPQGMGSPHSRREVESAWECLRRYVVEFRKNRPELKDLNVLLNFADLRVPSREECHAFVAAVTDEIAAVRARIGPEFIALEIGSNSPPILRKYLGTIAVHEAGCYMEWDWNQNYVRIGTSDDEMLNVIGSKLRHPRNRGIDSYRLVVAGFRSRPSEILAPFSAEHLNGYHQLNAALNDGPFDEVALLCITMFVWTRERGWRQM